MNLRNDPDKIDPIMTSTLAAYSLIFMRWSIAIYPPNYWLLGCHAVNEVAQLSQLSRWGWHKAVGGTSGGAAIAAAAPTSNTPSTNNTNNAKPADPSSEHSEVENY